MAPACTHLALQDTWPPPTRRFCMQAPERRRCSSASRVTTAVELGTALSAPARAATATQLTTLRCEASVSATARAVTAPDEDAEAAVADVLAEVLASADAAIGARVEACCWPLSPPRPDIAECRPHRGTGGDAKECVRRRAGTRKGGVRAECMLAPTLREAAPCVAELGRALQLETKGSRMHEQQ
jgi:hypothetical protein